MKCPNCGGEIENNAKFCTFCGSQITVEMQKEREINLAVLNAVAPMLHLTEKSRENLKGKMVLLL